ncbi:TraR/DksA family transcriptional regulator [Hyalangium versicolor]|uniref:TraR/DksA family transcriptional regulator n=1 Tax=Hyalangium versicolor TaxID=2861190 RepID=UPI001CCED5AB|nr:TraR/DksA C4-type zinc finger protein [Hyalangium versicolor]
MDVWEQEAREALMQRRSRLWARGAQGPSQEPVFALSEGDHRELRDIDDALARIQGGDFGRCARCGGAIGRHRLRAVPETRYCLTCSGLVVR